MKKMSDPLRKPVRLLLTLIATIFIWGHILWDHFHGGIPTHYLLHDRSMPGIPNWLGGILLPFFTYLLLYRIHKRHQGTTSTGVWKSVAIRFLLGLLFAVTISVCFLNEIPITDYLMLSLFVFALFFPLYRSEFLLGWVLGAALTFGATIPIGFGSLLCFIYFLIYQIPRVLLKRTKA